MYYIIAVAEHLLAVRERRVDADELREKCGPMARVIPVVPASELPPEHDQYSEGLCPCPRKPAEAACCEPCDLPGSLTQIQEVE